MKVDVNDALQVDRLIAAAQVAKLTPTGDFSNEHQVEVNYDSDQTRLQRLLELIGFDELLADVSEEAETG